MLAFDTTFLLDYLDGVEATREFLEANGDRPYFAPSLALFEVYRGGARADGADGVEDVGDALDWVEPLPSTEATAREAALVEAELLEDGERVNLGDVIIAGVCRHNGACVVTRDTDFERIQGLEVRRY